ncbi:MAG: hypothetical protein J7K47_05090, partial [Thermoplasmata archaeon]|nr:hypothetical protein [Thermoplasmata archaeon]
MAKWLCFVVAMLLLIPNIGMSEKRMNEKDESSMNENDMQYFNYFHHSLLPDFIHRIFPKMRNYAPVALMKGINESIDEVKEKHPLAIAFSITKGKEVIFNTSKSVAKQYRWDFDNDGVYDTPWLSSPVIKHVYSKPYNGFAKLLVRNEYGMDEKLVRVMVCNDEDQKQDKAEDFVKIYGSKKYAQTFKPTMLNLTGIKIYVARKGISLKILDRFPFLKNYLKNFFLGDLYIYIYRYRNGNPQGKLLTYVKLSPDEISKEGSWVSIDLKGIILAKNLEEWGGYYSIILYHGEGNERTSYYKWYYAYNDPYPNGTFYYYEGGRWKEDYNRDFAFITYGKPTGDEPDGIEERWAVLMAGPANNYLEVCANGDITDMKNVLINHGW